MYIIALFDSSFELWNPNTLDNTLNKLNVQLPGVNTPYLYFGMWKATFAWHVEVQNTLFQKHKNPILNWNGLGYGSLFN